MEGRRAAERGGQEPGWTETEDARRKIELHAMVGRVIERVIKMTERFRKQWWKNLRKQKEERKDGSERGRE